MATTANNHNQRELCLYALNEQQQQKTSSIANGATSPFQREVHEWQHIDPDTGAFLTGRLEADRWISGPLSKYGKISDSQNISQPNGTQQTQRKQLEVLQTCTPAGGAIQVIRSQTVQTISSRWSSSSASASPLLLSASTSPIPQLKQKHQQMSSQTDRNGEHNFKQKTHCTSITTANSIPSFSSSSPSASLMATTLLTNGFNHHHQPRHQLDHLKQHQNLLQYPHSFVIGNNGGNRNWPDIEENMSTLNICDNNHDNEHDHDNGYAVQQQSSDEHSNDDDSLMNDRNDDDHDNSDHHYLLNKRNNLKNIHLNKRHSFTVFANKNNTTTSRSNNHHHHDAHNYHHTNLSRDSSSGSCSNNNQLFLLDTAPSLKLSNLMKSSSSLSNSSNNSTTASQATTNNTHKNVASKVSLHAIVGSSSGCSYHAMTATTASSTQSATLTTTTKTTRPSCQQPTIYRQNGYSNNNNNNIHLQNYSQNNDSHFLKSRVGDNNNCCCGSHSSSGDESRSYAGKSETDLCHFQQQHHLSRSPIQYNHHQQQQQQKQQQQQLRFKQDDRLTPTHLAHRVDLESFRHYNNNDIANNNNKTNINNIKNNNNNNNNNNNLNETDDDGLRLPYRHLQRSQISTETPSDSMQRSRSISTDDLSTEWGTHGGDCEESAEWKRISKIRRSFQSAAKSNQSFSSATTSRRPLDLPTNSVSVSKIRADLENGRRLNTAMRNNHVDLAALSSILNDSKEKETRSPITPKRSSFLTAESLKEIRGKLKKLSDESLYKEDFIISQPHNDTNPEVDHIVNDQTKIKRNYDKSPDRYRVPTQTEEVNNKHTSNSLESRLKYKDTNSADWHLRRKSYGFEKMSPPERAMLRIDASTDSGLGRSGELQNWSPTSEPVSSNRTVVHLGESTPVQRHYKPQNSYEESKNSPTEDMELSKRHSIAVDESRYVRDNSRQTTQIHLNGFYEPDNYSQFMHSTESTTNTDKGQQKRVEFSKTEVHFATESGRVNIVETDSKPPPTNNFRRRRNRSSSAGPLQSLVSSATAVSTNTLESSTVPSGVTMPVTLFGDTNSKNKSIISTNLVCRTALNASPEPKSSGINVTVTVPIHKESFLLNENSRCNYTSTNGVDTTDCDTDEMTSLRGILKNKPAKPKPYVLGENIDKPDDLWGVQLKPVSQQSKSDKVLQSESPPLLTTTPQKSVAERIQELGCAASSQSNGFSTKINVSLGSPVSTPKNWENTDLPKSNVMSIKLHSPQVTKEVQSLSKVIPPLTKPRTIKNIQEHQPPKIRTATTVKQTSFQTNLPRKDSLKIIKEARGARQLREHELSYFGVPVAISEDDKPKSKLTTNSNSNNSPKRSLPLRKLSEETSIAMATQKREQWKLENDKPDLLKHNPIEVKPTKRTNLLKKAELEEEEEHLYENIANDIKPIFKVKVGTPPKQYDRKMDLQRDAMILSEMNENADQTLRELSDEAALKDRRRRSLQRRNSKPLETIDEKSIAEKISENCITVKVSRGTYSSEAKKNSRHSTPPPLCVKGTHRERTSSQSSVECCPRDRSRSLSSEKEYETIKCKPARSHTQTVKYKSQNTPESRSSSLDSQRSAHSNHSSENERQQHRGESFRREDHTRTKTKRISSSTSLSVRDKHRGEKSSRQSSQQHHGDSQRLSSTTHSLARRERVECKHDNATGQTVQRRHHANSSELQRSTATSSSGRKHKDDIRDSQRIKHSSVTVSGGLSSGRYDKHGQSSSKQIAPSIRDDEKSSPQRLNSHRLERSDKDKEKSIRSTKGHSSRSTTHHHRERSMNAEKQTTIKDTKTKSTKTENTTSSKNAPHHHQQHHASKESHEQLHHQHKSKRDEDQAEHVHGLKSAIIKTTTKLRDKSRSRKEKK